MNNKVLLFVVVLLLLGGVFVLTKNQNKMAPTPQDEQAMTDVTNEDGGEGEEALEQVQVSVGDAGFEPQKVTVKAGTKVVWTNNSAETADVSSAQHPTHLDYPPLNLGNFEPGTTVELVFEEPGEYKYHNHLDSTMFGTVVVE